jgi:hypothetical protein
MPLIARVPRDHSTTSERQRDCDTGRPVGSRSPVIGSPRFTSGAAPVPTLPSIQERLAAEIEAAGGEILPDPEFVGSIGTTMFDLPGSQDNTVTVVLPQESAQLAASQALVRIQSRKKGGDGRQYVGMVTAGPFAGPCTGPGHRVLPTLWWDGHQESGIRIQGTCRGAGLRARN